MEHAITITITPEMRALNEAIERFDNVTGGLFERFTPAELLSLSILLDPCFRAPLLQVIHAAKRANIPIE